MKNTVFATEAVKKIKTYLAKHTNCQFTADSLQPDGTTNIVVELVVVLSSTDPKHPTKYNINHGYISLCDGKLLTSHYIDGWSEEDRGISGGFQSIEDVITFTKNEISAQKEIQDEEKRDRITIAWEYFLHRLRSAIENGALRSYDECIEIGRKNGVEC